MKVTVASLSPESPAWVHADHPGRAFHHFRVIRRAPQDAILKADTSTAWFMGEASDTSRPALTELRRGPV